ncbi:PilN domain-containing protein [Chrysosporum bergii ANA360D]|uniref:PilN domain-containing protein n=1 Tax=Chrysosporum bergii ANA360D TaxID=617107 RepID=A0AA43GQG3_9CYAN|nr:PilN domain-containing protein [Chrysosporum bergii]MDH6059735.1 PilN domain-containing protein [Chrysosporum bergii ANA360D]
MYSLDVNFLKNRPEYQLKDPKRPKTNQPQGDLTIMYVAFAIGLSCPAFVGAGWWFLQSQNTQLQEKITQLDQENLQLDTEIGNINKIREETQKITTETQGLVTVFDQIRPWSAMLQDLRDRIPTSVQIENIQQIASTAESEGKPASSKAGELEITGLARSFSDVNDFVLSLQQSQFLQSSSSIITTASLIEFPLPPGSNQSPNDEKIKLPKVVKYTIKSRVSDVPASQLIRELEKKGAVGLVARIRSIQKIGAISQ